MGNCGIDVRTLSKTKACAAGKSSTMVRLDRMPPAHAETELLKYEFPTRRGGSPGCSPARPTGTVHASELPMLAGLVNELNTREICSSLAVTPMTNVIF